MIETATEYLGTGTELDGKASWPCLMGEASGPGWDSAPPRYAAPHIAPHRGRCSSLVPLTLYCPWTLRSPSWSCCCCYPGSWWWWRSRRCTWRRQRRQREQWLRQVWLIGLVLLVLLQNLHLLQLAPLIPTEIFEKFVWVVAQTYVFPLDFCFNLNPLETPLFV